ncbi:MAG: hypothetical protein HGA78_03490 [Nitrospirales bacterium]|nr:hypothetical protein [Nitrospirales bacterium]
MKWINHRIIGFSVPFILTGDAWLSLASLLFSTTPDAIETLAARSYSNMLRMKHRGISHHPLAWLMVFFALWTFYSSIIKPFIGHTALAKPGATAFSGFLWGVSLHLISDLLTKNGIPLSCNGKKRVSVSPLQTGSVTEYAIALSLFAFSLWMRLGKKFL